MLKREENVELFEAINNSLFVRNDSNYFDDAFLSKIKSLKIDNIKSLKGLDKLENLEYLDIVGKEDSTNIFEYKEIYHRNRDKSDFNMQKVFMYYYGEYTKNQIKDDDLKYIYKLKKLRHLNISRQRNITTIDLNHLLNLETLSLTECMNLKELKNLDKIKHLDSLYIDLAGCYRLKQIEGIEELIKIRKGNNLRSNVYLPTVYFSKLKDSFKKKINKNTKCFNWSELCPGYRSDINDYNMSIAYNLAMDIVEESTRNDVDKMDKVSSLYKWVCNHITYDFDGLKMNENAPLYDAREKYNKVIRSSFTTLYYKKGVCVGVSGLFNYLCSLVDVVAVPAYCSTKQIDFRRKVLNNHQISKIHLNKKAYYFDPTFDLDAIEFEFFGKNKDEISETHFLAMGEYAEQNGQSIQNILRVNGYIKNKKGQERGEMKKNRGSRR